MDDVANASGSMGPGKALIPLHRDGAREPQRIEIEGSWQRIEPRPSGVPIRRVATFAGIALQVWGGVSLAVVGGAALVYARGGLQPEIVATAVVAPPSEPVEAALAAAPATGVRIISLQPATQWEPAPAAKTPTSARPAPAAVSVRAPVAGPRSTAPEAAAISGPVILASAVPPKPAEEIADSAQAAPEEAPAAAEARLPRPRPDPPIETASIERQWEQFRSARHGGRYEAARARFPHRFRMPPL